MEENILKKANQKRLLGNIAIEGGNFTTAYFKQSSIRDLFSDGDDKPEGEKEKTQPEEEKKEEVAKEEVEKESEEKSEEAQEPVDPASVKPSQFEQVLNN